MQNLTNITQTSTGELHMRGTPVLKGAATCWDDMLFPFSQAKQGSNLRPDFDQTNVGLLFPRNDATEIIYIVAQIPHSYKEGTDLHPHLHWQQSASTAVTWKMDYKWFNIGTAVPADFTTIATSTGVITYVSGNLSQLSNFPTITGTGKTISSLLLIKIYRDDNVTSGDVLGFQFDIHFEKDTIGSRDLLTK